MKTVVLADYLDNCDECLIHFHKQVNNGCKLGNLTNNIRAGVFSGALALSSGFAEANQPHEETHSATEVKPDVVCTVSWNTITRADFDKDFPIDERYIGTNKAGAYTNDFYALLGLVAVAGHSGITYKQPKDLTESLPAVTYDISFQSKANYHGWLDPKDSKTYIDTGLKDIGFFNRVAGVGGVYDARYTNWTESHRVDIPLEHAGICLAIRHEIEDLQRNPPQFNVFTNNANDVARNIWSLTGPGLSNRGIGSKPFESDFPVTIIKRPQRLAEDLASGQLRPGTLEGKFFSPDGKAPEPWGIPGASIPKP